MAGHFSSNRCSLELADAAQRLVPATMQLWSAVQGRLLPTPTKFHYIFTLRDISRVFQGMHLAHLDCVDEGERGPGESAAKTPGTEWLVGLWAHECRRVFADKLISPEERIWMDGAIVDVCKTVNKHVIMIVHCCFLRHATFLTTQRTLHCSTMGRLSLHLLQHALLLQASSKTPPLTKRPGSHQAPAPATMKWSREAWLKYVLELTPLWLRRARTAVLGKALPTLCCLKMHWSTC